jgi:hypothetical protein
MADNNGMANQNGMAAKDKKATKDAGKNKKDAAKDKKAAAKDSAASADPNAAAGGAAADASCATAANDGLAAAASTADPNAAAAGDVVCKGSTVTLSGEAGAPAASSNQFPVGTMLKVTNLDNAKSITVPVTAKSGSCALLNNAAFAKIHQPGKQLIRKAKIEKIG